MSKYVCQICGYIYDEAVEKVKFDDLPENWTCPLCGAPKNMFKKAEEAAAEPAKKTTPVVSEPKATEENDELRELSDGELAAVFSNLSRGCEKQYKAEESKLYAKLAEFYTEKVKVPYDADFTVLLEKINSNLENKFVLANNDATNASDRGAKRVLYHTLLQNILICDIM